MIDVENLHNDAVTYVLNSLRLVRKAQNLKLSSAIMQGWYKIEISVAYEEEEEEEESSLHSAWFDFHHMHEFTHKRYRDQPITCLSIIYHDV